MPQKQECVLLLPAAGQGLRMGGKVKKPYLLLAGKPVIVHTLKACLDAAIFSRLIVLVTPGEEGKFEEDISKAFLKEYKNVSVVPGGISRQDSVFLGLKSIRHSVNHGTIVCVHDAVRPLVSSLLLQKVVAEAKRYGAASAGVPLTDTIKMVNKHNIVVNTPLRENFIAAQTPQCFKFSILWDAHCRTAKQASDDATLVEQLGVMVRIVKGDNENIKLTTPHDLKVAELCLAQRLKKGV